MDDHDEREERLRSEWSRPGPEAVRIVESGEGGSSDPVVGSADEGQRAGDGGADHRDDGPEDPTDGPVAQEPTGPEAAGSGPEAAGSGPGVEPGPEHGASGPGPGVQLPHWTDPPTGEVPRIVPTSGPTPAAHEEPAGSEDDPTDEDFRVWADLTRRAAWRHRGGDWDDAGYDPSVLGGGEARLGALREDREDADPTSPLGVVVPPDQDGRRSGGTEEAGKGGVGADVDLAPDERPGWRAGLSRLGSGVRHRVDGRLGRRGRDRGRTGEPDLTSEEPAADGGRAEPPDEPRAPASPWAPARTPQAMIRVATGVGMGALALGLFAVGPTASLALAAVFVTLAAAELYAVLRRAGYRPATLVGLVATAGIVVAGFEKGQVALPVVATLTVVVTLLWYLFGVEQVRPTVNSMATLLPFLWIGFLGAYAGLLLDPRLFPHRHGIAFLLGAAIAAVAYDVGALIVGSRWGRHPMAPSVSPNKTWEGMAGGLVLCLIFSVLLVGHIHPWDILTGLALGLVVSVVAPLGDLCESMLKRDLGIKDMGSLLPGHGGVLDRIDALLFVLPATFYLVRLLHIG